MKSNLVKDIISIVKTEEIKEEFNGISKLIMDFYFNQTKSLYVHHYYNYSYNFSH